MTSRFLFEASKVDATKIPNIPKTMDEKAE
jgi:hypothetical protein